MLWFKTAQDEQCIEKVMKAYTEEYGCDSITVWLPNQWSQWMEAKDYGEINVIFWSYPLLGISCSKYGTKFEVELIENGQF